MNGDNLDIEYFWYSIWTWWWIHRNMKVETAIAKKDAWQEIQESTNEK